MNPNISLHPNPQPPVSRQSKNLFILKCTYEPFDTELEGAMEVVKGEADAFVYDMPYNAVFVAMHGAIDFYR